MEERKRQTITIYSYSQVWKIEKKIYAIQNLVLPVPIDPWQLLYFGVTWMICNVVFGLLPGINSIPVVIRSMLVPYLISRFLMTKKLDGKNPIRYAIGIILFLFKEQGNVMEHFRLSSQKKKRVNIMWNCSEGEWCR